MEDGKQPQLLDLKTILEEFIKHRKTVVRRRTEYELKIAKARAHILEGLSKALDHIDQIISIIRGSETKEIARENLIQQFHFSDLQTDAILAMRLQTLAGLERQKIENELLEKNIFIADCEDILANPIRIISIVREEMIEIKNKYGDERKTQVIPHGVGEITTMDIIPNEAMVVTLSEIGYIKRMSPNTYRTQGRGGKGLLGSAAKTEDEIILSLSTSNHNTLLFFTSKGRVFRLPVYEIPEVSRTAKGQALVNFLNLSENETVTSILDATQETGKYLFFCTEHGVVKKVETSQFQNIRASGLIALGLKDDDLLKWVKPTSGDNEVMIVTKNGKGIRFSEEDVRPMGRQAAGVRGIRLSLGDIVVGMDIVDTEDTTSQLLVIMENGLGKSTLVSEYRPQGRGGSGVKTANVTPKTGKVVFASVMDSSFAGDLLLSAKSGQAIRMSYSQIPSQGRATQGVILMRLPKDDMVSTVSLLPPALEVPEILEESEIATLL